MGGHDDLEDASVWGMLPSEGRCEGVTGMRTPGPALGSWIMGFRAEPAWDQCPKGKARLPRAPNSA